MWPWKKTESVAMSGIATCDSKHHHFSVWEDIVVDYTVFKRWMSEPVTLRTNAQKRTCLVCHYTERRDMDI